MKICFTLPSSSIKSGIVRVVISIVNELVRNELFDICVLVLEDSDEKQVMQEQFDCEVFFLDINKTNKVKYYGKLPRRIRSFLKTHPQDCFVISGVEYVSFFLLAAKRLPIHLLAWEHLNFHAGPKFRLEWWGKRLALSKFDGIVTITKQDYQAYFLKKKKAELVQIYNLCALPGVSQAYCAQSKKIVSVGYLAAIKGFDLLIDVAEIVFSTHPDWTWDIYGEGTEREFLQQKINEKHLQNKVFLRGYHSNINALYEEYAFFVLTSRKEGLGVVMIEAQKNFLPIVAFDIPCGPADVIRNGENGFLIKAFDIDQMARKISMLMDSEELRKEFSSKSCMCHAELEPTFIVEKWTQLLKNTIQKNED